MHDSEGRRRCLRDVSYKSDEKLHLDGLGVGGRLILKWIFEKKNARSWTGFIWLRIWMSVRLLSARYGVLGFKKKKFGIV
jgi:hypothetical protein